MIDTLNYGGGIVSLRLDHTSPTYTDLGFCNDVSISVDIEEKYEDAYFKDDADHVIILPTTKGRIVAAIMGGSFTCESMTRKLLKTIWVYGNNDDGMFLGSGLIPVVRGFKFVSSSRIGDPITIVIPAISLKSKLVNLMGDTFKQVPFEFSSKFSVDIDTNPYITM